MGRRRRRRRTRSRKKSGTKERRTFSLIITSLLWDVLPWPVKYILFYLKLYSSDSMLNPLPFFLRHRRRRGEEGKRVDMCHRCTKGRRGEPKIEKRERNVEERGEIGGPRTTDEDQAGRKNSVFQNIFLPFIFVLQA